VTSASRTRRRRHFQGQIMLDQALFCVDCEVIYTGTVHCPRCGGGVVWPLADWLPSARGPRRGTMRLTATTDEAPGQQPRQPLSAA
jgi:hypothetical protein